MKIVFLTLISYNIILHVKSQAAQVRNKRNKWHVRERDSCLGAVLCYKDLIYKGVVSELSSLI